MRDSGDRRVEEVTVELGSGRGLENGLSCSSVMERPEPEKNGARLCIEID